MSKAYEIEQIKPEELQNLLGRLFDFLRIDSEQTTESAVLQIVNGSNHENNAKD